MKELSKERLQSKLKEAGESVAVQNSSKQTHDGNKNNLEHTQEKKKQIRRRRQKRKTRETLVKLKFFFIVTKEVVVILNCDIQILDNLFTPNCFRQVFLVWNNPV